MKTNAVKTVSAAGEEVSVWGGLWQDDVVTVMASMPWAKFLDFTLLPRFFGLPE